MGRAGDARVVVADGLLGEEGGLGEGELGQGGREIEEVFLDGLPVLRGGRERMPRGASVQAQPVPAAAGIATKGASGGT